MGWASGERGGGGGEKNVNKILWGNGKGRVLKT